MFFRRFLCLRAEDDTPACPIRSAPEQARGVTEARLDAGKPLAPCLAIG